jgi:hypothetical protein
MNDHLQKLCMMLCVVLCFVVVVSCAHDCLLQPNLGLFRQMKKVVFSSQNMKHDQIGSSQI